MFELYPGENISLSSNNFQSPLLILGLTGQGRSDTTIQIALQLIQNGEKGVLFDPYGDLTRDIYENTVTPQLKEHVAVYTSDITEAELSSALQEKFVLIHCKKLKEGGQKTMQKGRDILEMVYKIIQKDQWLIIDEAFQYVNDKLFACYITNKGIKTVLTDTSLIMLSEKERQQFLQTLANFVIYKIRNMDAQWLSQVHHQFNPDEIEAIEKYHFQALFGDKLTHTNSIFPIKKI